MSGTIYNGVASPATLRAGVVSWEIAGEVVDVASGFAYDATSVKREILLGQSGAQGYSEMPKVGMMSATLRDAASMSQARVFGMTGVSCIAVLASGKTIYGDNLTCTECSEVKSEDGTFDVKFEGYVTESSF